MTSGLAAPVGRLMLGILLTLLGVFIFSLTNAMAKWLGGTYPVGEVLFARSIVVLLLLAPSLRRADLVALRASGRPVLHVARALLSAVEVFFYYWAIGVLPLADGTAIYLAAPIYVTAMSALFLREQVGWRRWLAVLVGFAGVVVALQPGAVSFGAHSLVALVGSVMYAASLVITRQLRGVPTRLLVASQVLPLLILSAATAGFGWVMPSGRDAALLALFGALSMVAYLCINRAIQLAPASAVAPFNYASIVWAVLLGWLVFGDIPTAAMLLGGGIIVVAGLFILLRERVRRVPPSVPVQ